MLILLFVFIVFNTRTLNEARVNALRASSLYYESLFAKIPLNLY